MAPQTSTASPCFICARVGADEHAVAGGVAQRVDRRLLPGEVGRLRHELVGLDDGELGQAAEVGLEAPDALVVAEHRVVVAARVLVVDVVAVHDDLVARLPVAARPSRPAAPRPRRRSRRRGRPGRGACPSSSPGRGGRGTRRSGAARRSSVHTVLKLIELAMTATYGLVGGQLGQRRSPPRAATGGGPCPPTSRPSNMSCSSLRTHDRPVGLGEGQGGELVAGRPVWMASRICCMQRQGTCDPSVTSRERRRSPRQRHRAGAMVRRPRRVLVASSGPRHWRLWWHPPPTTSMSSALMARAEADADAIRGRAEVDARAALGRRRRRGCRRARSGRGRRPRRAGRRSRRP